MELVTVTGTYLLADGVPATGTVSFQPTVVAAYTADPAVITSNAVTVDLDDTGSFTVELLASDDPSWRAVDDLGDPADVPYEIREDITDARVRTFYAYIYAPGPVDITELVPVGYPPQFYIPTPGPTGPQGEIGPKGDSIGPYVQPDTPDTSVLPYGYLWVDTDAQPAAMAPVNSPVFTGTPTAPTPPPADTSARLATTAWVAGYIGGALGGVQQVRRYQHTQSGADTLWVVTHGLGQYPIVQIIHDDGYVVEATIIHYSVNHFHVTFQQPAAGYAICLI